MISKTLRYFKRWCGSISCVLCMFLVQGGICCFLIISESTGNIIWKEILGIATEWTSPSQCLMLATSKVWSLPPLPQFTLIVIIQQNYTGEQNLQARCRKQHCPHTTHRARNCDQLSLDIHGCDGIAQGVQRREYWLEDRGNWVRYPPRTIDYFVVVCFQTEFRAQPAF
jgi:hypothetical protein